MRASSTELATSTTTSLPTARVRTRTPAATAAHSGAQTLKSPATTAAIARELLAPNARQ